MKKKVSLALATVMAATALTAGVSATEYTKVNLLVNGEAVETDQPAVIVESRTMVPVRVIAESLGSTVDWDANTKTATFTYGDIVAALEIGGDNLKVTAAGTTQLIPVDSPATIINSRTMVPVRFLSETFGYTVDWDAATKTVNVTDGKAEDDTTSSAAVEVPFEGMADKELKEEALVADGYIAILNENTDKMTDDQKELLAAYSGNVADVLKILDMGDYTEAEISAGQKAVAGALAGLEDLAEAIDVDITPEEISADELKAEALVVDGYATVLNDYAEDMSKEQAELYATCCDYVATALKTIDMGNYTQEELEECRKAVEDAKAGMESIAKDLKVELTVEEVSQVEVEEVTEEITEETTEETTVEK